jgi:hypothetical protein
LSKTKYNSPPDCSISTGTFLTYSFIRTPSSQSVNVGLIKGCLLKKHMRYAVKVDMENAPETIPIHISMFIIKYIDYYNSFISFMTNDIKN